MNQGKLIKNTKYYTGVVYEFNLPTGTTCPFAMECKVTVDRYTGKFDIKRGAYKCYASSAERFPAVRQSRWNNFEYVKHGGIPEIPKDCKAIRIHASGDFFNQEYFDMWLELARSRPDVEFWAYTKSLTYWENRLDAIPKNLVLTASWGGKHDRLIVKHGLKSAMVFKSIDEVPSGMQVDYNDDLARIPNLSFALLDNAFNKKSDGK